MLKEILNAKYQNFYVNEEGVVCGIVTPREIWQIGKPEILLEKYQKSAARLAQMGNFDLAKTQLEQVERRIKRLQSAITKQKAMA